MFVFHKIMPPLDLYSFLLDGRDTFFTTFFIPLLPSGLYCPRPTFYTRVFVSDSMGLEMRNGIPRTRLDYQCT
jgi:hypothetical protein